MKCDSNDMRRSLQVAACATLLALGTVTPVFAAPVLVAVCNQRGEDGVYRPGLMVIQGARRSFHLPGGDGLTKAVVFDAAAATDWAREAYGIGPGAALIAYRPTCEVDRSATVPIVVTAAVPAVAGGSAAAASGEGIINGEVGDGDFESVDLGGDVNLD